MFIHFLHWRFPFYKVYYYSTDRICPFDTKDEPAIKLYRRKSDLAPKDIESFIDYSGERVQREFDRLYAEGAHLWLGSWQGKIAGICWTKYGIDKKDGYMLHDEQDSLILSCFVLPEFRGLSIYPIMIRNIANTLLKQGAGTIYIGSKTWNNISIRGIEKANFTFAGSVWELVIGRKKWIFRKNATADNIKR